MQTDKKQYNCRQTKNGSRCLTMSSQHNKLQISVSTKSENKNEKHKKKER